jgi:hypothetical protein
MIRYSLNCDQGHGFEAWFSNSAAFDDQVAKGQAQCPMCGSTAIAKAPMAPAIAKRDTARAAAAAVPAPEQATMPPEIIDALRRLRRAVETHFENVGERFVEEARRIHFNEAEPRGIYGVANLADVRELREDGIEVLPLPRLPEDFN